MFELLSETTNSDIHSLMKKRTPCHHEGFITTLSHRKMLFTGSEYSDTPDDGFSVSRQPVMELSASGMSCSAKDGCVRYATTVLHKADFSQR